MASSPLVVANVLLSIGSATDTSLVAAQPNYKIRAWQIVLQNTHASTDVTVTFKSQAGGTAISPAYLVKAAGGSVTLPYTEMEWFHSAKGEALTVTTSAAGTIVGSVHYTIGD